LPSTAAIKRFDESMAKRFGGKFKKNSVNEWSRMLAMDVSDVYYEQVMMNEKNR
jgi:hypothetical protein